MTPITSIRMLVVSRIFAGVALAIGVLGLMGYALALPALITVHSGYRGMAPLTATSIILVALSVVGLGRENPVTARLAAGLAICVAGIALVSHLVAGADVVSPWVANMIFATPAQIVGRMSYGSVLGVSLVAFSVIMRHSQSRAADLAGGAALIVSGVAVLGYAYGVSDLYALPIFNTMAVHTAIAIACLSLASLCAKSDEGWASIVASAGLGGGATRRQLTILLLPPVAGWGLLRGTLASALGPGVAMALLVIIMIVPLALLILRDGHNLDELDAERAAKLAVTDELTRVMEDRLEAQAAELTLQSQERERAEAAMYRAQRMEAIGQLTGGIAHDFNNLLMAVRGNLELLERRVAGDDRARRYVTNALTAADKGAKVTGQLLAFSRSQRLAIRSVPLDDTLRSARDLIGSSLGPDIDIVLDLGAPGTWVETDPDQLELAILNMAVNARDAMPNGGVFRIKSRDCTARLSEDDDEIDCVTVLLTDTGAGMPPEVAAQAVGPFFTTKERGKGTGLGLAQVYGFVRQCRGDLRITSAPGLGTTMEMLLRSAEPVSDPTIVIHQLGSAPVRQSGKSVLVIDDDEGVREVIVEALRGAGFEVVEAVDGASGLDLLETFMPIAAVIDFMMPGMNGAEVARIARQRRPGLPIIFVSGYSDTLALDGISDAIVLRKPFDMAGLQRAMSSLIH